MSVKLTTALLPFAARIAYKNSKVQHLLTKAFSERYGETYSEVDCDELIDILDYHGGHVDLSFADEAMTRCGCPPLK